MLLGCVADFAIFSNASDSLIFKNSSNFKELVYAPYAGVEMKNSADLYGAIWGNTVDIKNSGELYYDTSMKSEYETLSNGLVLLTWQDVRN